MNVWKLIAVGLLSVTVFSACASESKNLTADVFQTNNYLKSPVEVSAFLADLQKSSELMLLDVRTPAEFQTGCLNGAKNIDFEAADFEKKIVELDKDAHYLLYCRSGRRSALALNKMKDLGFKNLIELKGGINAWKQDGEVVSQNCK